MKRWILVPVFLGITLLALPNFCPGHATACSPPDLMSYAVAGERDVTLNLKETCQVKKEAFVVNDHIDAHRPAPHARKYIDGMRKDELLHATTMTSRCQKTPRLADSVPCKHGPVDQDTQSLASFKSFGQETWYPLSPDGDLPGKKVQIAMDMEKPSAESATAQKALPPQPLKILAPLNNQSFYGSPAKIEFRIQHNADCPVKYEFLTDIKVGNSHTWVPENVNLQDIQTISGIDADGMTPVQITSGFVTLSTEGAWKMHAWHSCPGSNISSWIGFTVKPAIPDFAPKQNTPPGWIKVQ